MDWIEVTVRTNTQGADMVSEQLMRAGAKGTFIEDKNDALLDPADPARWDFIDPALLQRMGDDVLVRGYLPADATAPDRLSALRVALSALTPVFLGFDPGALDVRVENVREEDWAENWKRYYKPFRVGDRLVVKPVWEDFAAEPSDVIIEIDPGMAFGNGTHETTAMCMALLETHLKPGAEVLDVGTGSGILAIAAAKLGARHVVAVDVDTVAVAVAKENVERNGVAGVVTVQYGDLLVGLSAQADLAVANIIADAIIKLSGAVKSHLKPGGVFISSGIIRDREDDVRHALAAAGFEVLHTEYQGEWVAFAAGA